VAVLVLASASIARADDAERVAMSRVRLSTDAAVAAGCARVAAVRDDSVKDLRKKIVRAGGDTAVISFGVADLDEIYAEVFRCAGLPPLPRDIPPPPPGPPPPPPPGPTR